MPRRVDIFEKDDFTAIALRLNLQALGCRVSEVRNAPPPPTIVKLPDADVVILDPRIFARDEPVHIVLPIWKLYENRVEIILHTDDWAFQEYRNSFKELGVHHGFTREAWPRMKAVLAKLT